VPIASKCTRREQHSICGNDRSLSRSTTTPSRWRDRLHACG
jgi:hypothetical protein